MCRFFVYGEVGSIAGQLVWDGVRLLGVGVKTRNPRRAVGEAVAPLFVTEHAAAVRPLHNYKFETKH